MFCENVLIVDHTTTEKAFKDDFCSRDGQVDLDNTLLNNIDVVKLITLIHKHDALVFLLGCQTINNLIENGVCVLQMLEEW